MFNLKKIFLKDKKKEILKDKETKNEQISNFIKSLDKDNFKLPSPKMYKELINRPDLHEKLIKKMNKFFNYKYYKTMEELLEDYDLDDWEIIKGVQNNKFVENKNENSGPIVNNKKEIVDKFKIASEYYLLPVKTKPKEGQRQEHALGMLYPTPKAIDFFVDNNRFFFISLDITHLVWGTKSLAFLEKNNNNNIDDYKKSNKDIYKILNFMETNKLSDLNFYQYDKTFYTFRGIKNLENQIFTNEIYISTAQNIINNILIKINEDVKSKKPSIAGRIKEVLETGVERSFRIRLTKQSKETRGNIEFPRMVAIRRLAGADLIHNLENLGYNNNSINIMKEALKFKNGLIIISGPTGKGKTTLLYSLLYYMNRFMNREIICVHQDTIEIEIDGFRQIDMSEYQNAKNENKMNLEEVIANILQQKPDVTLIDEVKRPEEMRHLIDLANKGHTTFTTLHTNDCASTLGVLENTGKVSRDFYVQSLKLVVNQDLVKKKCQSCNGTGKDVLNLNKNSNNNICEVCGGTGTSGVLPVYELAFFKDVTANDNPAVNFYKLVNEGKILLITKEEIARDYLNKGLITEKDYKEFSKFNVDNIEKIHDNYLKEIEKNTNNINKNNIHENNINENNIHENNINENIENENNINENIENENNINENIENENNINENNINKNIENENNINENNINKNIENENNITENNITENIENENNINQK